MRGARDDLIVGLLLIVVVLQAWSILVPRRTEQAVSRPQQPGPAAGTVPRSASSTPSPSPRARMAGPPLHLRELFAGVLALEADERLTLSPAQARRLLPVLKRYHRVYNAIPDGEHAVVSALTPPQRKWLARHVPRRPPLVDPHHSAEAITERAAAAALNALKK